MDQSSAVRRDGEDWKSTVEPGVSVSSLAEEAPTLAVSTVVGVTVVVLVAIVAVFLLGVLIDCRQQKLLEKRMGDMRRTKNKRRATAHPQADDGGASIVHNMEESELSTPPADALRNIP